MSKGGRRASSLDSRSGGFLSIDKPCAGSGTGVQAAHSMGSWGEGHQQVTVQGTACYGGDQLKVMYKVPAAAETL